MCQLSGGLARQKASKHWDAISLRAEQIRMANLYYSDSRDIVENDPAIGFDQNNNTAWLIHTYFVSEPLVKKKPRVQKSGAHGL